MEVSFRVFPSLPWRSLFTRVQIATEQLTAALIIIRPRQPHHYMILTHLSCRYLCTVVHVRSLSMYICAYEPYTVMQSLGFTAFSLYSRQKMYPSILILALLPPFTQRMSFQAEIPTQPKSRLFTPQPNQSTSFGIKKFAR